MAKCARDLNKTVKCVESANNVRHCQMIMDALLLLDCDSEDQPAAPCEGTIAFNTRMRHATKHVTGQAKKHRREELLRALEQALVEIEDAHPHLREDTQAH